MTEFLFPLDVNRKTILPDSGDNADTDATTDGERSAGSTESQSESDSEGKALQSKPIRSLIYYLWYDNRIVYNWFQFKGYLCQVQKEMVLQMLLVRLEAVKVEVSLNLTPILKKV